jgi:hypothetical protein
MLYRSHCHSYRRARSGQARAYPHYACLAQRHLNQHKELRLSYRIVAVFARCQTLFWFTRCWMIISAEVSPLFAQELVLRLQGFSNSIYLIALLAILSVRFGVHETGVFGRERGNGLNVITRVRKRID